MTALTVAGNRHDGRSVEGGWRPELSHEENLWAAKLADQAAECAVDAARQRLAASTSALATAEERFAEERQAEQQLEALESRLEEVEARARKDSVQVAHLRRTHAAAEAQLQHLRQLEAAQDKGAQAAKAVALGQLVQQRQAALEDVDRQLEASRREQQVCKLTVGCRCQGPYRH